MDMRKSALFSGLAHLLVIILMLVGLPKLFQKDLLPPAPIPIEVVNIADITQAKAHKVKPKDSGPKPVEEEKPKPKPQPPKPEEKVDEKKPDPEPEPKPEPKPEPIEDVLAEVIEKVEEKPKPKDEKKKDKPKKDKKKDKPKKDFMALLNNLEDLDSSETSPAQKDVDEAATEDQAAENIGEILSVTEMDLIRRQMRECWNVPSGTKGVEGMVVVINIEMNPDATVRSAKLEDAGRYSSDPHFRAVADSALRAAKNPHCNPLKLPLDRYNDWKSFTFRFDPKDMFQ
ncbi:Putative TonB C-terminal domain-containing protein [Candidatus Bealeia paramacronuclearis]|uniref:TonB C-terminal domain-containing protein n=1 Tax=Candidatus Bealeia paramacronuclearis TaxID=1921001 RepID=A0ABZ2C204_9PROT|nr:hypothetical protein [Candidatus Bealeia paramacronuclearis]